MSRASNGAIAEEIAIAHERLRLNMADRSVPKYVGNRRGIGFDIQSVNSDEDNAPRFIEVKSVTERGTLFLTKREILNLRALGSFAWLYLVDIRKKRVVKVIQDPVGRLSMNSMAMAYRINVQEIL